MVNPELVPLGGTSGSDVHPVHLGSHRLSLPCRPISHGRRSCAKGPLRAVRLLLLLTVTPALFVLIPMYLRYRVFSGQMYPVGMTDMRMIDNKISTTWCQKQVVRSNTTFNAFLMSEQPHISADLVPVSMTRLLTLQDDMKEYWGFYLLEGSVVTVSTCCRWPGASLTMIKGHKHLQQCAYIGDDSSEELEELLEANELGLLNNETLLQRIRTLLSDDSPANDPDAMKRHKNGVRFHSPDQQSHPPNTVLHHELPAVQSLDVTDHDPKELQEMLEKLHSMRRASSVAEEKQSQDYRPPAHLMSLPALHRHRDTNVDREERQWLSFNDIDGDSFHQEMEREDATLERDSTTKHELIRSYSEDIIPAKDKTEVNKGQSSSELYDQIVGRLKTLGDKGKRVLDRLTYHQPITSTASPKSSSEIDEDRLNYLANVLEEAIGEKERQRELDTKRRKANEEARVKRQVYLEKSAFTKSLNEDDEERNAAIEEGVNDGFAEVHRVVNESTPNDMSNSEFWSSFSSSEEALLECEGLILNLPLTPHPGCSRDGGEEQYLKASQRNAVTYRVPANGYYFFVFNSENEVQDNFIRVKFDLQKTTYDVQRTIHECRNYTDKCDIPLRFFSSEKVVLEVPLRDNDSLWNEEFVVISECVPRTSVYLACAIAVPLLVIIFAFQ